MKGNIELSIIIPCYNEERNLEETIKRISLPENLAYEIIIVNDGSQDKTKEIAEKIVRENKKAKLLNFEENKGKTLGLKEALSTAQGRTIIIHDADLTVAPEYISLFYKQACKSEPAFFMGTRFKFKIEKSTIPLKNLISNKITAKIFSLLLSQKITDTLCGTKLFPKELIKFINFSSCRWPDFDLIIAAKKAGLTIKEIPVRYSSRKYGTSKMKIYPDSWQLFKRLLKAIWELKI